MGSVTSLCGRPGEGRSGSCSDAPCSSLRAPQGPVPTLIDTSCRATSSRMSRNRSASRPARPAMSGAFRLSGLRNTTNDPVTLQQASVVGPGVGSVVHVVSIEVTPFPVVRGARSVTRPPVYDDGGTCLVGHLSPVQGYVLQPGGPPATLFVVMRSAEPGRYRVEGQRVVYEQRRVTYEQVLHAGVNGHVVSGAPPLKPYPEERACLHESGVELLPTSAPPPHATSSPSQ